MSRYADQPLPRYEKRYDDPTPWQVREEFDRLMREELVGPKDGEDEELLTRIEPRISNRYLLGVLAPKNTHPPLDDAGQLEPDEVESLESTEENPDEASRTAADSMLPTSIGLTFALADGVDELQVQVDWAIYRKDKSEKGFKTEKRGDPATVWKRIPFTSTVPIPVTTKSHEGFHDDFPELSLTVHVARYGGSRMVSIFLDNGQDGSDPASRDEKWLFQVQLAVSASNDSSCFVNRRFQHDADGEDQKTRQMEDHLKLLYREHVEFAVGHGTAVDWEVCPDDFRKARRLWTEAMPSFEVPKARTPGKDRVVTSMEVLGAATQSDVSSLLGALPVAYKAWIDRERERLADANEGIESTRDREAALAALADCERAAKRLTEGIELVGSDPNAFRAFTFMNRAMHAQRLHSLFSQRRRSGAQVTYEEVQQSESPSWRLFQLAFILISLPSLTKLDHVDRCESASGPSAELLWFSTGGGKTEAYLGLTAYTLAIRRLQGPIEGRDGENGVAVLMRYTLRLLTLQQFQRATALICACEVERRRDEKLWGKTPFRIGLWVGHGSTPNTHAGAVTLLQQERSSRGGSGKGTLKQITSCPWCGSPIELGRDVKEDRDRERILFYCGDPKGACEFSERKSKRYGEGVPILLVDQEVYRLLPSLVIATVDKFAQLPWNGEVGMLFGRVTRKCPRHGYLCPDSDHPTDAHVKTRSGLHAVQVEECAPLRPPDLIIQDELHLITGPLGSLVGLYETAVDDLCSWNVGGRVTRPKVILSTATIKRAHVQVERLFARQLSVFPPRALNADDTFFAEDQEVTTDTPGLRYVGVCGFGRRLKATLIRVYVAALCSARTLHDHYGSKADPYMTLVGYFASLRELGAMRRLLEDDVSSRVRHMDTRGLSPRKGRLSIEELTSRRRASDIPRVLDRLEVAFPDDLSKRRELERYPVDVLIATNMISVGVDVSRLGLMVVTGQPKSTSEYIQATSRVGREQVRPGIVFTVYNYARPRDISHYEAFRAYHSAYHTHVENPSVTPFASGAVERAIAAVVVGLSRQSDEELNEDSAAREAPARMAALNEAVRVVAERASRATPSPDEQRYAEQEAQVRADAWVKEVSRLSRGAASLTYRHRDKMNAVPLLSSYEDKQGSKRFKCLNSLRGVEMSASLILAEDFVGQEAVDE